MTVHDIVRIFKVDPANEEQMLALVAAIAEALMTIHEEAKCSA
jgi:hypothetical protein